VPLIVSTSKTTPSLAETPPASSIVQ
jgi:hypothetical protein